MLIVIYTEFWCSKCNKEIQGGSAYTNYGGIYHNHYHLNTISSHSFILSSSSSYILKFIHYLEKVYHDTCFVCTSCRRPLGSMKFCFKDDQPYCVNDFDRLFGKHCTGKHTLSLYSSLFSSSSRFLSSRPHLLLLLASSSSSLMIRVVCGGLLEGQMLGNPEGGFMHVECLSCGMFLYFMVLLLSLSSFHSILF